MEVLGALIISLFLLPVVWALDGIQKALKQIHEAVEEIRDLIRDKEEGPD
jgi:hypothetical protein